jgi:hypothetical protein
MNTTQTKKRGRPPKKGSFGKNRPSKVGTKRKKVNDRPAPSPAAASSSPAATTRASLNPPPPGPGVQPALNLEAHIGGRRERGHTIERKKAHQLHNDAIAGRTFKLEKSKNTFRNNDDDE